MKTFAETSQIVADALGIELIDTYEDGERDWVFEDDGVLHVVRGTTRAAFDVSENQMLNRSKQNQNTKKVLYMLGIKPTQEAMV